MARDQLYSTRYGKMITFRTPEGKIYSTSIPLLARLLTGKYKFLYIDTLETNSKRTEEYKKKKLINKTA